jgi:hypothetical protein
MFGPGIVVGSLCLFFLRLATTRMQFIIIFLVVPIIWVAYMTIALKLWRVKPVRESTSFSCTQLSLLHIGLTGIVLMAGSGKWPWAAPLVISAAVACAMVSTRFARHRAITYFVMAAVALIALVIRQNNPVFWYREATGIPYDETILEVIIHGLINWGPSTNGIQQTMDGTSSIAYHHLLLLATGLVDHFAELLPYQAQAIMGPFIAAQTISCCLILLVRRWLESSRHSIHLPIFVQATMCASLLGLRGAGFSSLTTYFGVAAILCCFLLITDSWDHVQLSRQAVLVILCTGAVAFAKGPYIYVPPIITAVLVVFSKFRKWILFVVAAAVTALLSLWFSRTSEAASEAVFTLWPEALFGQFSLSPYGLRLLADLLVSPLAVGVTCMIVITVLSGITRPTTTAVALSSVMLAAIAAKILVYFPQGGEEYWFHPGVVASSLLLIYLSTMTQKLIDSRSTNLRPALILAISLAGVALWLERFGFRALDIASALFITVMSVRLLLLRLKKRTGSDRQDFRVASAGFVVAVLFSLVSVGAFSRTQFPEFPSLIRPTRETSPIAWTGTPMFDELVKFVRENTPEQSLFASLVCGREESIYLPCTTDFRPAALTHRRFLMLGKFYVAQTLSQQADSDLKLVQSIGYEPASKVIRQLIDRGVDYLILDRSKVSDEWAGRRDCSIAQSVFQNDGYRLLQLTGGDQSCR